MPRRDGKDASGQAVACAGLRVVTVTRRPQRPADLRESLSDSNFQAIAERLDRLVELIERAVPVAVAAPDCRRRCLCLAPGGQRLQPVAKVNRIELNLLPVDRVRDLLLENTERFGGRCR